jgi:hypothetical protein
LEPSKIESHNVDDGFTASPESLDQPAYRGHGLRGAGDLRGRAREREVLLDVDGEQGCVRPVGTTVVVRKLCSQP